MLKQFNLGREAAEYLRSVLSNGKLFSKLLLELPLNEGHMITYLPEGTSDDAVLKFSEGGVMPSGEVRFIQQKKKMLKMVRINRDEINNLLSDFISDYLNNEAKRYAVFEDLLATRGDPFLESLHHCYFTCSSNIYHFLEPHTQDRKKIIAVRRRSGSALFSVGALTSIPIDSTEIADRRDIDVKTMEILATRTQYITVGAYDGEGDLIWCRK